MFESNAECLAVACHIVMKNRVVRTLWNRAWYFTESLLNKAVCRVYFSALACIAPCGFLQYKQSGINTSCVFAVFVRVCSQHESHYIFSHALSFIIQYQGSLCKEDEHRATPVTQNFLHSFRHLTAHWTLYCMKDEFDCFDFFKEATIDWIEMRFEKWFSSEPIPFSVLLLVFHDICFQYWFFSA